MSNWLWRYKYANEINWPRIVVTALSSEDLKRGTWVWRQKVKKSAKVEDRDLLKITTVE